MSGIVRVVERILRAALSSLPVLAMFFSKNWQMSSGLKLFRLTFPFIRCEKIFILHIDFYGEKNKDRGANESNGNVHELVGERREDGGTAPGVVGGIKPSPDEGERWR